jgi:hypothetical protein
LGFGIHGGGAGTLPLGWNSFEVIVIINVIEHLYESVSYSGTHSDIKILKAFGAEFGFSALYISSE